MKKMFVFVVSLFIGTSVSAQDFNSRLIVKLSEIMGVTAPTKIEIEIVSQKKLLNSYRDMLWNQCLDGHPERFNYCSQNVDTRGTFVHGVWIKEKDPNHLHIQIHQNSNAVDVVIHEFCHWYLGRLSPLLNNHVTLEALAKEILVSQPLLDWLEREQK